MTKDVLVSIVGYQFDVNEEEATELITAGEYYKKKDKHYILYEEHLMEEEVTKNIMKIGDEKIELVKRGAGNMTMLFEKDRIHTCAYQTPIGELMVGIHTNQLSIEEKEEEIEACIQYQLEVNGEHISQCEIRIKIQQRN